MGDTPHDGAAERAEELSRRAAELAAGRAITEDDAQHAAEHAQIARARDEQARLRARERAYEAAALHERAAEVQELAVEEGLGDVAEHRRAAQREREFARRDLIAAQEADPHDAE